MHSTERRGVWRWWRDLAGLGLIAGCSTPLTERAVPEPDRPPAASPAAPSATLPSTSQRVLLGPPAAVRNWSEVRLQAAHRLMAANPESTYSEPAPDALLAIPVLEIELNADGSIRRIQSLRLPTQAKETTQLAIDALQRAAPFGDVSRLPKPWRFVETFLFNDEHKFKPRTLD